MRRRLLWALAALPGTVRAETRPIVSVAAYLQAALEEASPLLRRETGLTPRYIFGATGSLARQIAQGAPFQLFLAADEASVFSLAAEGHLRDAGRVYGVGRLALFAPRGSALDPSGGAEARVRVIRAGQQQRFAIANPEIAPYGRAAEQALRRLGLWDALRPHLVIGENVAQAAQFAMMPGSLGGLIALSLADTPPVRARGSYALLPETLHEPLRHRMALTRRAGAEAEALYNWFAGPTAGAIFSRHGIMPAVS